MKVVAIIQARMGSTRLPKKVMLRICGKPMIELLISRLKLSNEINEIVVATSVDKNNKPLIQHLNEIGVACVVGSEDDVLGRYLHAAKLHNADIIVRITGDCPLVDPKLVDYAINRFKYEDIDYLSNLDPATYPDGLDIEVFSLNALKIAGNEAKSKFDREHVTPFIRNSGKFSISSMVNDIDLSDLRWTVDEQVDFQVIKKIFESFSPKINFSWKEVLELRQSSPKLFLANGFLNRNEGASMSKGQKLWRRAKQLIPGGNMLLSKRSEMFLPEQWPSYFSKSKGCKVWDLDGNEYIDMSIMGVGTNILGYGHHEVDAAVLKAIGEGNMSTFNCPEEVYLAEKLIELHPWAQMARFTRTGGEANAVAIRIARAASGKDNVAICGYHGWHDWYLSANLGNDTGLDGHLLPGLEPIGVPRNLKNTVYAFNYNNFEELLKIVNDHNIGVIKMEVARNIDPKNGFLSKVRQLATERNIVLIFDECTSGFRETFGGLHLKFGVTPDIAIFGKTLGNGYAIAAIIGKKEVMEAAQSSFISSTFWTERIGPVAALKTLEVMGRLKSWKIATNAGSIVRQGWQDLADKYELKINHWGLPALTGFTFESDNSIIYKTLITQEMLSKGYLAGNSFYACIDHSKDVIENYLQELDDVFKLISDCELGRNAEELLKGPVCHSGFKRLN